MHSTSEPSPSIARPKPDMLSDASDYRRLKDVLLQACSPMNGKEEPHPIVVYCPFAGKPGRPRASNNHNKDVANSIMGATVMWLVCPYINAMIGRMEGIGLVRRMHDMLLSNTHLSALHVASHGIFEKYVCETLMKDESMSLMYRRNFIDVDDSKRKYGNAGVCHATDMKCYHALVAQTLGGADNPVGSSLVLYFFHLFEILECNRSDGPPAVALDDERKIGPKFSSTAHLSNQQSSGIDSDFVQIVENQDNYFTFLTTLGTNPVNNEKWKIDMNCPSTKAKCEMLPMMCRDMLMAVEGKPLSMRKKRRIN